MHNAKPKISHELRKMKFTREVEVIDYLDAHVKPYLECGPRLLIFEGILARETGNQNRSNSIERWCWLTPQSMECYSDGYKANVHKQPLL